MINTLIASVLALSATFATLDEPGEQSPPPLYTPPPDDNDSSADVCDVNPNACDPNYVQWVRVDDMLIPCWGGDPWAFFQCIFQPSSTFPCPPDHDGPCY